MKEFFRHFRHKENDIAYDLLSQISCALLNHSASPGVMSDIKELLREEGADAGWDLLAQASLELNKPPEERKISALVVREFFPDSSANDLCRLVNVRLEKPGKFEGRAIIIGFNPNHSLLRRRGDEGLEISREDLITVIKSLVRAMKLTKQNELPLLTAKQVSEALKNIKLQALDTSGE